MKELLKQPLAEAEASVNNSAPKTKNSYKSINIDDVDPKDLALFMKKNNVPDHAYFDADDELYCNLEWVVDVPTTNEDKLKHKRKRFNYRAWLSVRDVLLANGYKRVGYNSGLLREFNDTTPYDMYMDGDFDRLVRYYSLPFEKE